MANLQFSTALPQTKEGPDTLAARVAVDIANLRQTGIALSGTSETLTGTDMGSDGTIGPCRSVTISLDASFVGTIGSATVTGPTQLSIAASPGNTLAGIAYTKSAGAGFYLMAV